MAPGGPAGASVYFLGAAPSEEEDEDDEHWTDKAGQALRRAFGRDFMASARSNFVTQCRGDQTAVEVECCRPRVAADVERVRPLLIVGIGDPPLAWVLGGGGLGTAMAHRGSLFVVRVGSHVCWYYCMLYPSFVHKKSYGRSEYELAMQHDADEVKRLARVLMPAKAPPAPYDGGIEVITGAEPGDMQRLERALQELAREPRCAVDIETTGLRPYMEFSHPKLPTKGHRILTAAVGTFRRAVAFPVDHPEGWGSDAQVGRAKALFFDFLMESGRKAVHNLALEMEWFAWEFGGAMLRRTGWDDTMAMAHTLDERKQNKSLEFLTVQYFGFNVKKLSAVDSARLLDYPLAQVLKYNALDTKWTDALRDVLEPLVDAENRPEYERKLRLAPTLVRTEEVGREVDFDYARAMKEKFRDISRGLETRIARCPEVKEFARRFGTFSPTNPDDVLKMLKEVCKRGEVRVEDKRTKSVRWTTDEEALSTIPAAEVPSVPLILEHRGSSKLEGTYIDPVLSRRIVCADGLIRCKYSSMTAETGRLTSEDPNDQNWPTRKHREVRGMVRARKGNWLVACDQGQIEFRVVGMASMDENLVRACWTGYDVHKAWALRLLEIHPAQVDWVVSEFGTELKRAKAKAKEEGTDHDEDKLIVKTLRQEMKNKWVFPQFFGSSIHSCAAALAMPDRVAAQMGEELWDEFPGVKRWHKEVLRQYELDLYVKTLTGRKRRGPMTPNQIINHPIQGTAWDIVGEAYNELSERADAEDDPDLQSCLVVHDDLTFDMPDASLDTKIEVIARSMCMPRFDFVNVPLVVEVKIGKRWSDMEEIKVYRSDVLFGTPNPYS